MQKYKTINFFFEFLFKYSDVTRVTLRAVFPFKRKNIIIIVFLKRENKKRKWEIGNHPGLKLSQLRI